LRVGGRVHQCFDVQSERRRRRRAQCQAFGRGLVIVLQQFAPVEFQSAQDKSVAVQFQRDAGTAFRVAPYGQPGDDARLGPVQRNIQRNRVNEEIRRHVIA